MTNTAFELDLNDEQEQLQLGDFEDIFAAWIDGNLKIEDTYDAVMQEFIEDYEQQFIDKDDILKIQNFLYEHFYHFEDIYDAEYNELL